MPTDTLEEFPHQFLPCYWPREFTKRRQFNRQAENQPYLEFLQTHFDDGDDEEDEGDDADGSSEDNDKVDGHGDKIEYEDENSNDDKNAEACNGHSNVRLFMTGMEGDEDALQYCDQVEQVAGFCKQASFRGIETGSTGSNRKGVALLDDRNDGGTILVKHGHCRPYLGPLTAEQLGKELSKKRFRVESDLNVSTNAFEEEESDAERRVIFITNLDASTIEALISKASRTQAPALKDLLYKHLTSKTSIGVTIPSQGFRVFTLDFHIPFYVLRESKEQFKDTRKKFDGKPLRQSWDLPLLPRSMSTSTSTDRRQSLYEAKISVAVAGIDSSVWISYGIVDTYFESDESVDRYHRWNGRRGRADPLADGQIDANNPIWMPREYFLKVFEIRINQIRKEWHRIIDKVEGEVEQSRTNYIFPLASKDSKTRQEVREFVIWNTQMVILLRQLISCLSDTVEAWDVFRRKEIGYFLYDEESPTASSSLKPSAAAVDKTFSDLKVVLRKMEALRKELCEDHPQGLNAHLSLENNEAAKFQQRTAGNVQVLTVITIVFYPLVLAASLFSTQGVLPFTPNLAYFTYVLVILAALVAATLAVLFNWDSWFRPTFEQMTAQLNLQNAIIKLHGQKVKSEDYDEGLGGEGILDASTSSRALKRRFFRRRPRKAARKRWDPEKGIEKGNNELKQS